MSAAVESLSASLRAAHDALPGHDLAWLKARRAAAFSTFEELGFPTLRHEDWKYTNVRNIERRGLELAGSRTPVDSSLISTFGHDVNAGPVVVLHDGKLDSVHGTLPAGVSVLEIADAASSPSFSTVVQEHLGQIADVNTDGFAALNGALMADGLFIHVAANIEAPAPLTLLFVASGTENSAACPRNLFVLEAGANLNLVQHNVSPDDGVYLNNSVTEIVLAERAQLEHRDSARRKPQSVSYWHHRVSARRVCRVHFARNVSRCCYL